MAVPTLQQDTSEQGPPGSAGSRFLAWLRRIGPAIGRPVFAVILALIAGAIVIMLTSPGSLLDRFTAVINAYTALYTGSFSNPVSISNTLVKVTPLIFASLSVAIAFRAGLFNIGAAGQIAVGAMAAGIVSFKLPHWPGWALIPLMVLASMLAGAVWGGIVGFLKAWRGAHEVVTTIMLNWIAFYVTDYLIDGPFTAPGGSNQTNPLPPQATLPQITTVYNQLFGGFLPKADPYQYLVDVGFFLALLAIVVYWFITARTTFGYEIRVLGQNPKAAQYAGIPAKLNTLMVMMLAGAFAGLGGALRLMGQFPYQLIATTFRVDQTGFDAIGAALLGQTTPVGVLLGSLLFGGLRTASPSVQITGVSGDIVLVIEALVLFSIASEFLPSLRRVMPGWFWLRLSRRPELVPPILGSSVVEPPTDSNGVTSTDLDKEAVKPDEVQANQDGAQSPGTREKEV